MSGSNALIADKAIARHTPGPWIVDEDLAEGWNHHVYVDGTDNRICFMAHNPDNQAECDANARLIAAAPDLLAALKALDACYCEAGDEMSRAQRDHGRMVLIATRAAIAKAEGRS